MVIFYNALIQVSDQFDTINKFSQYICAYCTIKMLVKFSLSFHANIDIFEQ